MANILQVKVQSPREVLYKGEALAVSSTNIDGRFDILPQHANFITIIQGQPIDVILPDRKKLTFKFREAIIFNTNNYVIVFAEPESTTTS